MAIAIKWILEQIEKQKTEKRFYLLCKADIPWEGDPQRENPNDRVELFEIYKQELDNLGHNYFIVEGENRIENSICKNIISNNYYLKSIYTFVPSLKGCLIG